MNMHDDFMLSCKRSYINKITPSGTNSNQSFEYKQLLSIVLACFDQGDYEIFSGLLQDGQYFISLWAAHFLIEFGHPNAGLKNRAFNTITEYANSALSPDVAVEEKKWLDNNRFRF